MKRKRLKSYQVSVPGGFLFTMPGTGVRFKSMSWSGIINLVYKHAKSNDIELPMRYRDIIEDATCERNPECCHEVDEKLQNSRVFKDDFIKASKTVFSWLKTGMKKVPQIEANRRAGICAGCDANVVTGFCQGCSGNAVGLFINNLRGKSRTSRDSDLDACAVCGCSLKVLVHLPLEVIQKHSPENENNQLPDNCWKKKRN